jgi:hypothetical protein
MRRIRLSITGGILLPATYAVLLVALINIASFVFRFSGRDTTLHAWAESLEFALSFPVSWPSYIYFHYYPPDPDFIAFTGFELGNIISVAAGNLLLYSVVAYSVLSIYKERVSNSGMPPTADT